MATKPALSFFLFVFVICSASFAQNSWLAGVSASIDQDQYAFKLNEDVDGYTAVNIQNKLGFFIGSSGYSVRQIQTRPNTKSFELDLHIQSIQGQLIHSSAAPVLRNPSTLVYYYGDYSVEYINNGEGLRQNFIISNNPLRTGLLQVDLHISSTLKYNVSNNDELTFVDDSGYVVMFYDKLKVWDATGRVLHAVMKIKKDVLMLQVDDADAVYPVTIDPLNHSPEWMTSSDGILPSVLTNLSMQVDALYGYSSTSLGDINNDGYDDVAVGAPGAVNVIGGNSFVQAGAVFIYYGSSTGLGNTPSKVLRPTTAVAGALFGFSLASGDIVGGTAKDLIVGAPLDSYSTLADALFPSSVTVTAGRVYVFRGEDMNAGTPSPFLNVRLQGTAFFSHGILNLLLSNVSNKNLFGFSVAVTEDLNNDNKGDLVVGVPGFLGVNLLSVRSGAAFVFYSNNLSSINPVQLTTPTPSVLGLASLPLANTDALLFGYSVDGAGDFNGDGNADIVVGAPAGVNLNSLGGIFTGQFLSGSAHVFYGTSASGVRNGISPTSNSVLQPSASDLLGNAANLFGYSVRGVRNASNVRNGRILVGAPVGNVLSNVISGLRLKAGNIYLYKNYAAGAISPSQQIGSPRGSSLLSVLSGQNLSVSAMFGASMDNTMDINCDGISDIIVGEPLSTGVGLVGADAVGGAAFVFTGNADGTYNPSPLRTITSITSMDLGVNVASMLGTSVTGAGRTHGSGFPPRILVGAPGKALDFGAGLLNLGSTFSNLFSFTSGNNGLGKAMSFSFASCSVLPVKLLTFTGTKIDGQSLLKWSTTDEMNFEGFEVQHSSDGTHFSKIGWLTSLKNNHNVYSHYHLLPARGLNYYRLKMVDRDGVFRFSAIIQLNFNHESDLSLHVFPNPVQGNNFTVQLTGLAAGNYCIALSSLAGQRLRTSNISISSSFQLIAMTRTGLAAGIYCISALDNNGKVVGIQRLLLK